jgi:F0F1-type ATP synthase assembly protein I
VTTLGGALAGRWLDLQFGTHPWLLVVGFILGVALGGLADWRLVSRFLDNLKDS